ncbi:PEGA domain-containing protein [Candidatus Dojkabacteria bacterium]|nr:PEGA domain-containing protein [Candidatus Dojkabacteria bacterium]
MKKSYRIIIIVFIAALAIAAAILRPWSYLAYLPIVGKNAALTVNTTAGKSEVFLDGKKIGETPLSSENLAPGDYKLKVSRISGSEDFYTDITKLIHLEQNTRTFVEAEIGPSKQFSSLKTLYYKKIKTNESELYIKSSPPGATVWIDNIRYGDTPVTTQKLDDGRHEMKISLDGYEDEDAALILREGYTLIAEIELMARPVQLD